MKLTFCRSVEVVTFKTNVQFLVRYFYFQLSLVLRKTVPNFCMVIASKAHSNITIVDLTWGQLNYFMAPPVDIEMTIIVESIS